MDGVVRTTVGYAGGVKPNPTYKNMGDHTESVEVIFDPSRISFEQLLEVFWSAHDPRVGGWSRQYRNAVFFRGEQQEELARRSLKRVEGVAAGSVQTDVEPLGSFYAAEAYHQKYMLRRYGDLFAELVEQYGSEEAALTSTTAARMNGYLGGYGNRDDMEKALDAFRLSAEGRKRFAAAVRRRMR